MRVPASHCGLVGLRPTHGRIPLQGCHDLAPAFDTCGFFTRDLATFERVARVLLDRHEHDAPRRWRTLDPADAWALPTDEARNALAPARRRALSLIGEAGSAVTDLALDSFEAMTKAFRDLHPDAAAGFTAMHHAALAEGVLSTKAKELQCIAVGIVTHCADCIGFHVRAAIKAGATREEIAETIGVCVMMGGGPAYMYGVKALEVFDQLTA